MGSEERPAHVDGHSAMSPSENRLLHPYSCLICRKKKKKCDRIHPCLNCHRVGAECVFAPRRPSSRRGIPLGAMERLHHLEDAIGSLRAELSFESSRVVAEGEGIAERSAQEKGTDSTQIESTHHGRSCMDEVTGLETEFGRLAVGDGRSRYIVGSFWASLNEEVCHYTPLGPVEILP
jgi:hypothetical protein